MYFSVIAMISGTPTKMRQTNKKALATFGAVPDSGFTIIKNPPKLVKIPPTIVHPTSETIIDCK